MDKNARLDCLPDGVTKIWQDPGQFCFTTDAVFLAAFPHVKKNASALELGCGTGAVSLLTRLRGAGHVLGIDNNPRVIELFRQSIQDNGFTGQVEAKKMDVRELKHFLPGESMDLVLANPPYRIGGRQRRIGREACHEVGTTLEDFFQAASYTLKTKGRFALVQLPERFTEAVLLGEKHQLELKKLQWVHAKADRTAWIFLAEFVKGGHPGLAVLPPLIMYNPDGSYTRDTLTYYGKNEA